MTRSLVTTAAILVAASFLFAVPTTRLAFSQQVNLDTFPRLDPENLPERYREWLTEVDVILTRSERDVFLRCDNDVQRDRFIEGFWLVRDPTPGTPRNESQEQHYERLEYADSQFSRDTSRPGSQTDRGRIYLLLGKPMDVNRLPNTQSAYPAELWFYHADPRLGVPSFFYVAFYKYLGYGEYILYRPVGDGPMKLLNPAGVAQVRELTGGFGDLPSGAFNELSAAYSILRDIDFELAHAAFSLIPGEGSLVSGMPSLASDVLLGEIHNIPNRLVPSAAWAYPVLTGIIEAKVRFETLPVTISAMAFIDPSGVPFIHYAAQTEGGRLNLNNYQDSYYLTFQVAGSLADEQQNIVADIRGIADEPKIIEEMIEGEENARKVRSGSFIFMDQLPTIEGWFRLDLVLENNVSHEFGHAEFDLQVPSVRPQRLSSSAPLLVRDFEYLDSYDPYAGRLPFQLGRLLLFPAVDSTYASNESLHVFHQVYLPPDGEDAARASGGLRATYRLEFEGGFLRGKVMPIDLRDADTQGIINVVASLDLKGVPAGEYQLRVDVDDDDREAVYVPVSIKAPTEEQVRPFVRAQQQLPATDPRIGYERALQYRAIGKIESALDTLGSSLSREPNFKEGLDLQTELLMEAGRYQEVDRLLVPRQIESPNDGDLLVALAKANAGLGRHHDAIRYYERARLVGGEETPEFLNALAGEYYADGQVTKARELLERSRELQPDQPEVQRLLDQVLSLQQNLQEILETFGDRVDLIMTDDERDGQWKNLETDEGRRAFVTEFWDNRDPTPGTAENEFREIYMRRVQTATQRYRESVPGYMTDRGKVYIIYGQPGEQDRRQAADPQRRSVGTGMDILWRYDASKNPYLEQDEILFGPSGPDDYSLESPIDLTAAAFLAGQEVRDSIATPRANLNPEAARAQAPAATPDLVAMRRLLEEGVRQQDLALQREFAFFPAPENNTFVVVAFKVGKAKLTNGSAANEGATALRAFGLFLQDDAELGEQPLRPFSIDFIITDDEGTEQESATHSFGMTLPPGSYRLAWGVMDIDSSRLTTTSEAFEVPNFATSALTLSTVVASRSEPTMQTDVIDVDKVYNGIRVGNAHFDTDIDHEFASTETIELLYFVMGAQPDPGTQQLRLEVTHRILRGDDGQDIGRLPTQIHDFFAIGQQIPLSQLSELAAGGSYRIEIHIRDLVSGAEVVQEVPFTVAALRHHALTLPQRCP